MNKNIGIEAEENIRAFFAMQSALPFHNLAHTESVVALAQKIARHSSLSPHEQTLLTVAAWFCNAGYYSNVANPQAGGADMAAAFLNDKSMTAEDIQTVKEAIIATASPQRPSSPVAQVLCDAGIAWIAAPDFFERNKLLRSEMALLRGRKTGKAEWLQATGQLLETHRFHTGYGRTHLNQGKQRNLTRLKKKLVATQPQGNPLTALLQPVTTVPAIATEPKKESRAEKTVETMFRITSANSQRLSDQADTKAHIMISVNSIIISVLLSMVVRRMNEYTELTVPVIVLLTVNLLTIMFSILATRPNIPTGLFTEQDVQEKKVNLLFFGNFYRMNFDDYFKGMGHVMNDHAFLKQSLLRDIYSQGVVLGRKYRMLKTAYNIFMFGLIASVIAFFVVARY